MKNIYNLSLEELEEYFINLGEKKYKGTQVFEWLYRQKIKDFDEITNMKKELLSKLKEDFYLGDINLVLKEDGKEVHKFLFKLKDGMHVESVLMLHDYGNSICLSTQVGCNMGCAFCESGRLKKKRNLEMSEMIEQILKVEEVVNLRVSHVVFMGIGEPFDNWDNFKRVVETINHDRGLAIGARHITVSTCGIVPKIKLLSDFPFQINLAISLHAATNELRNEIMPINKVYPLEVLIPALKEYIYKTNRRLTIEYIMLSGINDSKECAQKLVNLIKGMNVYVNLIPYNETSNLRFKRPSDSTIMEFYDIIKKARIAVTIRREFGGTISAACGQLKSTKEELK